MSLKRTALRHAAIALAAVTTVSLLAFVALRYYLESAPNGLLLSGTGNDGWRSYGGTWKIGADSIVNDSTERGAKLTTGSLRWRNYTLESDLESLGRGRGGDLGLVVRSSNEERGVDAYSGYYAGLRWQDSSLIIGRSNFAWAEFATIRLPARLQPQHWYHLKVVAVGCTIAAQFSDPATNVRAAISMNEAASQCATTGRVALRSVGTAAAWKNIRAFRAGASDLEPILTSALPVTRNSHQLSLSEVLDEYKPVERGDRSLTNQENHTATEPLADLRLASPLGSDQIEVRGKVILTNPALFVQDSTGGALIPNAQTANLNIGDEVLVRGKAEPHQFSSVIRDAVVTMLWPGEADPPISITPSQAATGVFDSRFVELQAYLARTIKESSGGVSFDVSYGVQNFRAFLPGKSTNSALSLPAKESLLRIRGICVTDSQFTHGIVPFTILLRSLDDISVISGPPWWSARNLITGAVISGFLALLGYLFYVRIRQWRLQAVIEERLRLAHELHDTLAQSFAGVGYQLRAILKSLPSASSPIRTQVETASELVRQGHQEARRSISSLRNNPVDSQIELLPALDEAAKRMIAGGTLAFHISSSGEPRRIPLKLADILFRTVIEAIANAVRHASPSTIHVHLAYGKEALQISVTDDGKGFQIDSIKTDGFGLSGIKSRVRTVGGKINISSTPGTGTHLDIEVPLPSSSLLTQFLEWTKRANQIRRRSSSVDLEGEI